MLTIAILALCVGTSANTISNAKVFRRFRRWAREKNRWLGQLVNCPYCTMHYIAFAVVAVLRPTVTDYWWLFNYVISAFTIIALAAIYVGILINLIEFEDA